MDISTAWPKSHIHTWTYPWISISTASLEIHHMLCVLVMLQEPVNVTSLAEETYSQLSDDVTCRASALRSLVMTSCSGDVIRILTALCSQLIHLRLIDCIASTATQVTHCSLSLSNNCSRIVHYTQCKGKGRTLVIAPFCRQAPPQRRSGTWRTPSRVAHTCLIPSQP